ncbi:MAG: hypothetical protein F9K22_01935 [Bacteroidetes bacterium]|nr:MAG: hypothetical protein F9K22_01935 [Bacteroidota bacterium]
MEPEDRHRRSTSRTSTGCRRSRTCSAPTGCGTTSGRSSSTSMPRRTPRRAPRPAPRWRRPPSIPRPRSCSVSATSASRRSSSPSMW